MNQYIIPLPHNDPRLLSHVSHAFSLVDLGKRLLDAAKNGDVEEVKNLMNSGAPFTTDWLGISPLHFAAMNGHLTSCEALLGAGISRDARTKVDRTPLHLAAQEGHADIVELLLRSGADLGAKDMLRMTALHWAAERGHAPVVQMLMRFGADAHVKNKFELTPLNIAQGKGHVDACDAMLNCQHDLVSSVGSMNAINGDLQATNAYILTDEKTLVPAAPPAGEVIVTATTVDDNDDEDDDEMMRRQDLEAAAATASFQTVQSKRDNGLDNGGHHNRPVPGLDQFINPLVSVKPDLIGVNAIAPVVGRTARLNDGSGQAAEHDIMIVETPEGDLLYVRQQSFGPLFTETDDNNPLSLAIYTSTGDRIDDPPLLAQVTEVMSRNMANQTKENNQPCAVEMSAGCRQHDAADRMLGKERSVHETRSPTTIPPQCPPTTACVTTASDTIVLSGSQSPPTITVTTGCSWRSQRCSGLVGKKRPRAAGSSTSNDMVAGVHSQERLKLDEEEEVVPTTPTAGDDRLSIQDPDLLARLASLASAEVDACGQQACICLEGVGVDASSEDVYLWCMCQGLYPRGYTNNSVFMIEFIYQDEAFTLSAEYDTDLGVITVRPASASLIN